MCCLVATKEAEGDHACISDVIPLLKKLHYEVNIVDSAGVVTLKSSVLSKLKRYFDTTYGVKSRKEYGIATLLDPRYNFCWI